MFLRVLCFIQLVALLLLTKFTAHAAIEKPNPVIYEISVRPWLYELSQTKNNGKAVNFHSAEGFQIIKDSILEIQRDFPMDYIWFMGIWQLGEHALNLDRGKDWSHELPGFTQEDIIGSPFAVTNYTTNSVIGTDDHIKEFRKFLNGNGIKLMLDFVPNHVAVDHPWICSNPEFLMPFDDGLVHDGNSCLDSAEFAIETRCGKFFHGGDYWNSGWTDTLQLNYWNPELRQTMKDVLQNIASMSDGIRIDMAMVVLNTHIEKTWVKDHDGCSTGKRGVMLKKFSQNPPSEEFWSSALSELKKAHPSYLVMAEAYNYRFTSPAVEDVVLRTIGFDYTYDIVTLKWFKKKDYKNFFNYVTGQGERFLSKSVHFVENHDDNRAAGEVMHGNVKMAKVGALAHAFIPGVKFFNHGQFQCLKNRLGVHLRRSADEQVNEDCVSFFKDMIPLLQDEIMQKGSWKIRGFYNTDSDSNVYGEANWYVAVWEFSYEKKRRLVAINLNPNDGDWAGGKILLEDIEDHDNSRSITINHRIGARVETFNSYDLREAGFQIWLEPGTGQVFDYEI